MGDTETDGTSNSSRSGTREGNSACNILHVRKLIKKYTLSLFICMVLSENILRTRKNSMIVLCQIDYDINIESYSR